MPGGARLQMKPKAVLLVASGERYDRAAEKLGVDERTLRRWAGEEAFAAEVRALRGQALTEAAARLADGLSVAAATMVELLDDDDPKVRLSAAREVVAAFLRVRHDHLLECRLTSLEARAAALGGVDGSCDANGKAD